MWAVVQISLPHKNQEGSAAILHLRRLLRDGNVSNVARRLNESRFIGMAWLTRCSRKDCFGHSQTTWSTAPVNVAGQPWHISAADWGKLSLEALRLKCNQYRLITAGSKYSTKTLVRPLSPIFTNSHCSTNSHTTNHTNTHRTINVRRPNRVKKDANSSQRTS